ncbi:MAG: dioxygenase [Hyphomicrobiales bacterium]|nr:MAG: dioxygenase [Hyphomicrobiales bacterium]
MKMPSLFLPHGAPDLPLSGHPAAKFLQQLKRNIPNPKAIVIISAHWETFGVQITTAPELETIYDFGGFPSELYDLKYAAKTTPELIEKIKNLLGDANIQFSANNRRGLDHGAWVPLWLAFPDANIPIVQLSLDRRMNAEDLFKFGQVLGVLREQNILIIGSGASVHNLGNITPEGSPVADWAIAFNGWLEGVIENNEWQKLLKFSAVPHYKQAHPTPEHLLPLIVAAGAGLDEPTSKIHSSFSYGSIGMSAWMFGD